MTAQKQPLHSEAIPNLNQNSPQREQAPSSAGYKPPTGTLEAWDHIAPGYDRTNTPTQIWLGNEALQRAGLRFGSRFLDVAAGSGALSIPAARIGATVVAVDHSKIMLELLEKRANQESLPI